MVRQTQITANCGKCHQRMKLVVLIKNSKEILPLHGLVNEGIFEEVIFELRFVK